MTVQFIGIAKMTALGSFMITETFIILNCPKNYTTIGNVL